MGAKVSLVLSCGELPARSTFDTHFDEFVGCGRHYHVRAGLSGLFVGTSQELSWQEEASFTCSELWDLLNELLDLGTNESLDDADCIFQTLGFDTV